MDTRKRSYKRKLEKLERLRRDLAKRIDTSYLRDDISSYIELEARYKDVMESMQKLKGRLSTSNMAK